MISHSSWLAKPKKWHSMEIESKFVGALCAVQIWKHIHSAFKCMNRLNMYCTPPERLWVRMNANEWVGRAPEHPLSVHECNWVIVNTHWVCMTAIESLLMRLTMVWHEKDRTYVRTEWLLNTCECVWMPLSEWWTPPKCLWVHLNTFEWVLNKPWMLVSVHDHQWVSENSPWTSIECTWMPFSKLWKVWMCTSRVVNLTNL